MVRSRLPDYQFVETRPPELVPEAGDGHARPALEKKGQLDKILGAAGCQHARRALLHCTLCPECALAGNSSDCQTGSPMLSEVVHELHI
jgi:hypothetical protein